MRKCQRSVKHLLIYSFIFTLGYITASHFSSSVTNIHSTSTPSKLSASHPVDKLSASHPVDKLSASHPADTPLRKLVHLRVDGPVYKILHQYRNQLDTYFRNNSQHNEDEAVYRRRQKHVDTFCKRNEENQNIRPKSEFMFIDHPKVLYCRVCKVGSRFWGKVLSIIEKRDPKLHSPFEIHEGRPQHNHFPLDDKSLEEKQRNGFYSFVFARDPYHRMFSVFIDKILAPNPYLWGIGMQAIVKFRTKDEINEKIRGANVRFDELIKHVNAEDKRAIEKHLRPVTYTCNVCNFKYDVIGKIETFEKDVNFILKRIGVLDKEIVFHDMKFESSLDLIFDYVWRTFHFKARWMRYISVHAGMQRLWRQLQINGLIDMTDTYPFSPEQSHNVTVVEYINVALEAFRRSSPAAKRTKREAYLQAYSMLEPEDLEKLRKAFLSDFEMFDYEQRPAELFNMDKKRKFDYDYFDVMDFA